MTLQFEIFDDNSGVFNGPGTGDPTWDKFIELLEDQEMGEIGDKPFLAEMNKLLADAPDFFDVHGVFANHWHCQGKPKKALDAALLGLSIANRQIPESFTGRIEWGHLENRPYLRLMNLALHSYMRLRRHRDAATMIELMLARNPNDNQGVRFLLGSEALRSGQFERARAVLENEADDYPPYYYELGLCCMLMEDWVAAATALRRGFAASPYVAEILCGSPNPAPLAIWHDSNLAEPETAIDYIQQYAGLWQSQPGSFAFVRWLFNHSKVLAERAAIMECADALLWERDETTRSQIGDRQRQLKASIDDTLSAAIVAQREDRSGQLVWPWQQT